MNKLLDLLKTMLFPINGTDDKFALGISRKGKGIVAKGINHDSLDLNAIQSLLSAELPGWEATLFEASSSFDPITGKPITSSEKLYCGPNTTQTDDSEAILAQFG